MPHSRPARTSLASSLKRLSVADLALVHDLAAAPQAGRGAAGDLALGDEAARDEALGEREDRPHLGRAELDLLDVGLEQVGHHLADLVARARR